MDNRIVPLEKTPYMIVSLAIVDDEGLAIVKPYVLEEGANAFRCLATYVDGSRSFYSPYWTCPLITRGGGVQPWSVLGRRRRDRVVIHTSAQHERYTELACWVFPPDSAPGGIANPRDSTSFDYFKFE